MAEIAFAIVILIGLVSPESLNCHSPAIPIITPQSFSTVG
jgi:hypothetical protein